MVSLWSACLNMGKRVTITGHDYRQAHVTPSVLQKNFEFEGCTVMNIIIIRPQRIFYKSRLHLKQFEARIKIETEIKHCLAVQFKGLTLKTWKPENTLASSIFHPSIISLFL